jgi:hypothetical protein
MVISHVLNVFKNYQEKICFNLPQKKITDISAASDCIQYFENRKLRDESQRLIGILLSLNQTKHAALCINKFKKITKYDEDLLNEILLDDNPKRLEKCYKYIVDGIDRKKFLDEMFEKERLEQVKSKDEEKPANYCFQSLIESERKKESGIKR